MSETKKEEEQKEELSEAEKTAVGQAILDELVYDVITSDTTQPSVPGVVLDTINDIILSEVAIAKEGAAKEKEDKEKEDEKQRKEEKKKKEEEKKKKKQPTSPPPIVIPAPKSPTSPKSPAIQKSPEQYSSTPTRHESEIQEAKLDMNADEDLEHRNRKIEPPKTLPAVIPDAQPQPDSRQYSQTEPNITINGQNVPQEPVPVVLNGHVITGQQQVNRRQDSRDSVASSQGSTRRSGSHTPTSPTTPWTPATPPGEDQRPQYNRAASQDSKRSSSSAGKVCGIITSRQMYFILRNVQILINQQRCIIPQVDGVIYRNKENSQRFRSEEDREATLNRKVLF